MNTDIKPGIGNVRTKAVPSTKAQPHEAAKSSVATGQFSANGALINANPAFYQLTGIANQNPEGNFMQSFVHPLDYPLLSRKFLLAATTGKTYEAHVRLLRNARKEYQTLHFTLQPSGKVIDVELAPEASANFAFHQSLDLLPSPALLYDENFNLLKVNAPLSNVLGYSAEYLDSTNPITLICPESLPAFTQNMRQMVRKQISGFELELILQHKEERHVWVKFTASRVHLQNSSYIIALIQDITELKLQQQEVQRENLEMRNLLDKAARDIKTPIRSLLALYHIIEMEYINDGQAMEYFNHYNSSLTKLGKIVDDLITLNEVNKKTKTPSPVNFRTIVQKCLQNLSSLTGFYKIDFDIQVEIKEPVLLEERLVATVLHNLIENAIRYNDNHQQPKIRIGVWKRQNQLTIEIADNGAGIPEDIQEDVFDMFVRGRSDSPGAGLGLFIVKNAIDKLKGTIRLRSKARQGTWFKISIPL